MEKRQESLIEHLEALRSTLIKCFAALGIGLLPMFLAAPDCIDLLIRIMTSGNNISLNYFSPMEVFVFFHRWKFSFYRSKRLLYWTF